jgi:hypothetical protein
MSKFKCSICRLLVALLVIPGTPLARASAYDAHPKLVIILVVDQFRADYLDRYRADLKGRGFRLFLDHGAYFEDCYYDYANTKTAPGHATLATGAYTDGHGISSNEWWDLSRNKQRPVSSVEDDRYRIVGEIHPSKTGGASPLNLRASTIGDSLRLATTGQAKVFGVSLKDRAAILPAGYSANGAYWIDPASGSFITSSYYMDALPDWATAFNSGDRIAQAEQEAGVPDTQQFYEAVGSTPAANAYELDFARALITGEQLGNHPVTDLLVVSLSANDIVGHKWGPDSPQSRQMVDSLDQQLDSFFTWLDKNIPGGLASTWIALSADHGVAPVPAQALALGMPAATIDMGKFTANVNDAMNAKFSPGEKIEYLLPQQELPYRRSIVPHLRLRGSMSRRRSRPFSRQFRLRSKRLLHPAMPPDRRPRRPVKPRPRAPMLPSRPTLRPTPIRRLWPEPLLLLAPNSTPEVAPLLLPLRSRPRLPACPRPRRRSACQPPQSWCIPTPATSWPRVSCPRRSGDSCWPTVTAPTAAGTSW